MILCWVDIDLKPAEFKIFRTWESDQNSETCFDLTSKPTLILVEPKASLCQSLLRIRYALIALEYAIIQNN